MKRRTEITVETDRVIVVRRRREKSVTAWCMACDAESVMLTVNEAASVLGASSMNVFRWAEAGHLHWLETERGAVLICQNSLTRNPRALLDSHHD